MPASNAPDFRFSGHETFPCRYAWLPKAFTAIESDAARVASGEAPRFTDDEAAMVDLGIGKNMVRAVRFWMQAAGIATVSNRGASWATTEFGRRILRPKGFDQFLEDVRTLWLIHWRLSTHVEQPLFAWDFLLNRWQHPELSHSAVMQAFRSETRGMERNLSDVTLEQHFDTFLHSYVPTRSRKGDIQEDNLDCPLVELSLIQKVGERRPDDTGRREAIYAFRRESKPEISSGLFLYCVADFWAKRRSNESTLTFRDVAIAHGSPGQILKLPEWDLRDRLESIASDSGGMFIYKESASVQQLSHDKSIERDTLAMVYDREVA